MFRFALSFCLSAACAVSLAQAEDLHLQETGSAAVLLHSTFAHGYRHGYEEGYHAGNADINMGRLPRAKGREDRGLSTGYSSRYGSRKSFEKGFLAGLKAGYSDGYLGRNFRAVATMRAVATALDDLSLPADPKHTYFDSGFFSGYNDGFARGGSGNSHTAQIDFHQVGCSQFHPTHKEDIPAQGSYCEGYRRGFALGHEDGFVLRPETVQMEASK